MIKNYFRLAWRHLVKQKGYSFINIAGLATGMAIALLIGLWIQDELSYDHYSANHSRIAKGMIIQASPGQRTYMGDVVTNIMGTTFRSQYKDLFTRTAQYADGGSGMLINTGDKTVTGNGIWAQSTLPSMFGFQLLRGALPDEKDPSTAIISQSMATSLFGNTDPIGQSIKVANNVVFRIGAVYADLPRNTTFYNTQVVMPWYNQDNKYHNSSTDWDDHSEFLYVELAPGVTAAQATARINLLPTPHIKECHETALVYPLDREHLYYDSSEGYPDHSGRIRFVWLFGIIGAFVLLLACINFMNLSTARSEKRAKEVGIRKTIGSVRKQLVTQFLAESVLVTFIALFFALLIAQFTLPYFNQLSAKDIRLPLLNPFFWLLTLGFATITGLLAGSYPAFYLSSFRPVQVLKGSFKAGRFASVPRQILVVLQFTVSLTLVIGTIVVFRQVLVIKDRPVGYTREGLITVAINTPDLQKHYESLRTELIQNGLADDVAASDMTPTSFGNGNGIDWPGKRPDQQSQMFRNVNITPDYGHTIRWTVVKGRDLSRDFLTDSGALVMNEAAAKFIGIKDPIGLPMNFYGMHYTCVGIVKNMLANNPYDSIEPALFMGGRYTSNIIIRIKPGLSTHTALTAMEPIFKRYNPASPFLYRFVSDDYAAKFAEEERTGHLAAVFTALAIFISCLGLFGLAAFVAEQRTKEIGVRKVLGASLVTLWGLLSKDFLKLTAIAMLISVPLAWWGMQQWLGGYNFHANLPWWIFAAACAGLLLITLITVSFQSIKAALMNPVKSLRSE
jgi:ABC-type antimicrobial peptide transport system permease subunit